MGSSRAPSPNTPALVPWSHGTLTRPQNRSSCACHALVSQTLTGTLPDPVGASLAGANVFVNLLCVALRYLRAVSTLGCRECSLGSYLARARSSSPCRARGGQAGSGRMARVLKKGMDVLDDKICVPVAARASVRVSMHMDVDEDSATGAHSVDLLMTDSHPTAGRIEVFSWGALL
jgi:hypothetical protein